MESNETIDRLLETYQLAAKLKTTLRHSWLPETNRQESTAEHTWMLTFLALVLFEHVTISVDQLKVLKLLIIHDLGEAIIGDIPIFEESQRQNNKSHDERQAIDYFAKQLPAQTGNEIRDLWEEFEARKTPEAKLAHALDKLEALMQHNIAGYDTWSDGDFKVSTSYKGEAFQFDRFMNQFKRAIDYITLRQIDEAGLLDRVNPEHVQRYRADTERIT